MSPTAIAHPTDIEGHEPSADNPPSEQHSDSHAAPPVSTTDVASALVLLQGAIWVALSLEGAVGSLLSGGATLGLAAVTASVAIVLLVSSRGLRRRSRKARPAVLATEGLLLVPLIVDLVLALALTGEWLELVPTITRIGLPVAIVATLRTHAVRVEFGLGPSRRRRRRIERRRRAEETS